MQIFSKDKTVRNNTLQDLRDFNSQSVVTKFQK